MAEKKISDCERLTLSVYRDRGDEEQDAVLAWLDSLPRKPDGSYQRETIRRHMMRALYQYVMHGTPKYPLNIGVVQPAMPILSRTGQLPIIETAVPSLPVSTVSVDNQDIPVLTTVAAAPSAEPVSNQEPEGPKKIVLRPGMKSRIAASMTGGTG